MDHYAVLLNAPAVFVEIAIYFDRLVDVHEWLEFFVPKWTVLDEWFFHGCCVGKGKKDRLNSLVVEHLRQPHTGLFLTWLSLWFAKLGTDNQIPKRSTLFLSNLVLEELENNVTSSLRAYYII